MTVEAISAVRRAQRGGPPAKSAKIAKELRDWVGKEIRTDRKPKDIRFATTCRRPAPERSCGGFGWAFDRQGEEITQVYVSTLENPAILIS